MKETFKLILYQSVYYLVKSLPAKTQSKHLILVKTDEIGDYMLIRNLLGYFKKSALYKEYTITLVGNSLFKQVFDAYDTAAVDNVIWVDKKKFRKSLLYRYRTLKQVRGLGASVAVNLIYSRSFRVDDLLVAVSGAAARIGMENTQSETLKSEKWITPRGIFTQLIYAGDETLFDVYRNARFIEGILGTTIHSPSVALNTPASPGLFSLPPAYFVVFPGSGIEAKKWPAAAFAAVAEHVSQTYGLMPVVCGSGADKVDCDQFIETFGRPVIDLTGKTTLPQLLAVLKSAACLVSVDTGSVHMAAAVGCPVFALFSGLHYGRFAPYPKEIAPDFFAVYPDSIEEMVNENTLLETEKIPIDLLKKIPPAKVIRKISEFFALLLQNGSAYVHK